MHYFSFTHNYLPEHGSHSIIIKFADNIAVVWQCGVQTTILHSIPRRRSWLWTTGRLRKATHTLPFTLMELKWNVWLASNSLVSISLRIFPGSSTLLLLSKRCNSAFRKAHILLNFYKCVIESILTNCITMWYGNCTVSDQNALQWVVKNAQNIIGAQLYPRSNTTNNAYEGWDALLKTPLIQAMGCLFTLLPSGRRYRSFHCRTSMTQEQFLRSTYWTLN